jgi:hypothetical protein
MPAWVYLPSFSSASQSKEIKIPLPAKSIGIFFYHSVYFLIRKIRATKKHPKCPH